MREDVVKLKLCLVGDPGVGKSSLVRRYVYHQFSDRYQPTLGANISRKDLSVESESRTFRVVLTIWDIMGEPTFRDLLKAAYFHEAQGVLAVADLSRPETLPALRDWVDAARGVSGLVPAVLLGNKVDLDSPSASRKQLADLALELGVEGIVTSAKTGEGVEGAFMKVAQEAVRGAGSTHRS